MFTAEEHEKAIPVILVHPAIEQWVDKSRAHRHDVKQGVNEFIFFELENQVEITSQLKHVEGKPANSEDHDHQRQHLRGLLPAADAITAVGRADVVLQFDPDAHVSIADDRQRDHILQEKH